MRESLIEKNTTKKSNGRLTRENKYKRENQKRETNIQILIKSCRISSFLVANAFTFEAFQQNARHIKKTSYLLSPL
jgi:hypothetical protein